MKDVKERGGMDLTDCFIDGSFVIEKRGFKGGKNQGSTKPRTDVNCGVIVDARKWNACWHDFRTSVGSLFVMIVFSIITWALSTWVVWLFCSDHVFEMTSR